MLKVQLCECVVEPTTYLVVNQNHPNQHDMIYIFDIKEEAPVTCMWHCHMNLAWEMYVWFQFRQLQLGRYVIVVTIALAGMVACRF